MRHRAAAASTTAQGPADRAIAGGWSDRWAGRSGSDSSGGRHGRGGRPAALWGVRRLRGAGRLAVTGAGLSDLASAAARSVRFGRHGGQVCQIWSAWWAGLSDLVGTAGTGLPDALTSASGREAHHSVTVRSLPGPTDVWDIKAAPPPLVTSAMLTTGICPTDMPTNTAIERSETP